MGSKAKFLLSLNLLLYVLSTTTCDTSSNSSSPSGLPPPSVSGAGAYVAPFPSNSSTPPPSSGGSAYVAPCLYNSSAPLPSGAYVAPCPYNSSTPPSSGGGAYMAPCPYNSSSLPCLVPPSGGGVYMAPCPRDALKLGVCANLVGKAIGVEAGNSSTSSCCTLVAGLADLDVAVCFCTAIRANILGIKLDIPISLSILLNMCGINHPTGFVCA